MEEDKPGCASFTDEEKAGWETYELPKPREPGPEPGACDWEAMKDLPQKEEWPRRAGFPPAPPEGDEPSPRDWARAQKALARYEAMTPEEEAEQLARASRGARGLGARRSVGRGFLHARRAAAEISYLVQFWAKSVAMRSRHAAPTQAKFIQAPAEPEPPAGDPGDGCLVLDAAAAAKEAERIAKLPKPQLEDRTPPEVDNVRALLRPENLAAIGGLPPLEAPGPDLGDPAAVARLKSDLEARAGAGVPPRAEGRVMPRRAQIRCPCPLS